MRATVAGLTARTFTRRYHPSAPSASASAIVARMSTNAAATTSGDDANAGASTSLRVETPRWRPLRGMRAEELRLRYTLPTGQSFRWRPRGCREDDYVGVIGGRVVRVREGADADADAEYKVYCRPSDEGENEDEARVREYFNADVSLADLYAGFRERDERFRALSMHVPGARMLSQDPGECLFSFICSSNNHISRIHGMVERMCVRYGDKLPVTSDDLAVDDPDEKESFSSEDAQPTTESTMEFYTFPSATRILREATEEELRALGFGYRAKFIVGSAETLAKNPLGKSPDEYLASLRDEAPYVEAHAALMALPGVGPKVSACVCLFSLRKHQAIPVDTHVWQFATEHYMPELRDAKSVTPRVMRAVELKMEDVFGPYAGWAHNALFIAELKSVRDALPDELKTPRRPTPSKKKRKQAEPSSGGAGGQSQIQIKPEPVLDIKDEDEDEAHPFGSPKPTNPSN